MTKKLLNEPVPLLIGMNGLPLPEKDMDVILKKYTKKRLIEHLNKLKKCKKC